MKRLSVLSVVAITGLLTGSCNRNKLNTSDVEDLREEQGVSVTVTADFPNSEILSVYEDHGFAEKVYYLFHLKESDYYHKLPQSAEYTVGQVWNSYLLQTCSYSGQASDTGQWVKITKSFSDTSGARVSFDYTRESISNLGNDMLYKQENGKLIPVDSLNKFCSLHDLDSGLYYLSPPAIFYASKADIRDIEKEYE